MKKQFLSLLFAAIYLQALSQNYCITDQYNFGGSGNDAPVSIIKISDGYVLCGFTDSHDGAFNVPNNHDVDAFVAKFDFNHNLVWQHTYGGKNRDDFWKIKATDDGGFIAAGQTASNDDDVSGNHGGPHDVWVVKLNALGMLQWQHCYGGKGDDLTNEINVVPGGYQVVGLTDSDSDGDVPPNHGGYDAWILTISSTGNVLSSYCYGGSGDDEISGIIGNPNGTSTFNGATLSNDGQVSGNHGNEDIWLVNIDNNNGNINWQKCIGGAGIDNPHAIARTGDGNIVLSIASNSSDGDFTGSWSGCQAGFTAKLIKVNPETGTVIWNRNYPVPGKCTASFGALVTADGGILSMGLIADNPAPNNHDAYVFKVDADGNMLWDKILGGSKSDNVVYWKTGIEINNQYLIPFTSQSKDGDILNPLGGADGWIVTLGTGCNPPMAPETVNHSIINGVAIFPNPVTTTTTISFSLLQKENVVIQIFDSTGRLIKTLSNREFAEGMHYVEWDATDAEAGIYFMQFQAGEKLQASTLMVTK